MANTPRNFIGMYKPAEKSITVSESVLHDRRAF